MKRGARVFPRAHNLFFAPHLRRRQVLTSKEVDLYSIGSSLHRAAIRKDERVQQGWVHLGNPHPDCSFSGGSLKLGGHRSREGKLRSDCRLRLNARSELVLFGLDHKHYGLNLCTHRKGVWQMAPSAGVRIPRVEWVQDEPGRVVQELP